MKTTSLYTTVLLLTIGALAGCNEESSLPQEPKVTESPSFKGGKSQTFAVSGSALHYLSTSVVHSQQPTANGMIQLSSEMIRLTGDVNGYVLYHPTGTFDFANQTLVNSGTQIFSGTVAGSGPVILHDDQFRFDINLANGATTGSVHLGRSKDAPDKGGWFECNLSVVVTGWTPEGDNLSDYTGECTKYGQVPNVSP